MYVHVNIDAEIFTDICKYFYIYIYIYVHIHKYIDVRVGWRKPTARREEVRAHVREGTCVQANVRAFTCKLRFANVNAPLRVQIIMYTEKKALCIYKTYVHICLSTHAREVKICAHKNPY